MLSRAASNGSLYHPRRKKSNISTRSQREYEPPIEPMDPEKARQLAIAAATTAFQRASERQREHSTRRDNYSRNENPPRLTEDGKRLERRQSVRFIGPLAPARKTSLIRARPANPFIPGQDHIYTGTTGGNVESFVTTEIPTHSSRQQEDDEVSIASSYRRLRKSRSLFGIRKHTPVIYNAGTPETHRKQSSDVGRPRLRITRSMSLRRSSMRLNYERDAAVQMARDKYLRQLEEQRLKERPSFMLSTFGRRHHHQKSIRETVRTTSPTTSLGICIASSNQKVSTGSDGLNIGGKARHLSLAIRKRLRRVFKRPAEPETIPLQQLEATRPHFGDYVPAVSGVQVGYENVPPPDHAAILKINSRMPMLHQMPSYQNITSAQGSIGMVDRDDDFNNDTSRASSWTNSTFTNNLTGSQAAEINRLSIIQENGGPHQPSLSRNRYGTSTPGANSLFRKPIPSNGVNGQPESSIDSQRVYSALLKRLDENAQDGSMLDGGSDLHYRGPMVPVRSSSRASQHTYATIRLVSEDTDTIDAERLREGDSRIVPHMFEDDGQSPTDSDNSERTRIRLATGQSRLLRKPSYEHTLFPPPNGSALTPQMIANHNEGSKGKQKQRVRETRSSLFPYSTEYIVKTPSPFRQALDAGRKDDHSGRGRLNGKGGSRNQGSRAGSSDYSRTTSGEHYDDSDSSSFADGEDHGEPGTAVIIATRTGNYPHSVALDNKPETQVLRSSNEWRAWTSSQIAFLEKDPNTSENVDGHKNPGHRREFAQIDGGDTEVCAFDDGKFKHRLPSISGLPNPASSGHGRLLPKAAEIGPPPTQDLPPVPAPAPNATFPENQLPSAWSATGSKTYLRHATSHPFISSTAKGSPIPHAAPEDAMLGLTGLSSRSTNLRARSIADLHHNCSPGGSGRVLATQNFNTNSVKQDLKMDHKNQNDRTALPLGSPEDEEDDNLDGTGLMGPSIGGQRLVDLFLSSRRRRMNSSIESDNAAFL